MKINGLIWLDNIVDKLHSKHSISQDEVREILANQPKFRFVEKGHYTGENVYLALGQTDSGRYLVIFFVRKKSGQALIISGRDMTPSERRQYGRK